MISLRTALLPLLGLLAIQTTAAAQRPLRRTQAFVDTLQTSSPLPSRGSLGGLSADAEGNLYVANFGNNLWKITKSGRVTLLSDDFIIASGNTIAPDGTLYQSDFGFNRIYSVDKDTGQRTLRARFGLNGPVGLAVDASGALFVANCNGQNVRRAAPGSQNALPYASGALFSCPNGIALGPSGELYVSNFFDDNVLTIPAGGGAVNLFAALGTTGVGGGHLVLVGSDLYATKLSSHDLYRVRLSGSVEVVAGQELLPGLQDGPVSYARLRFPNGIAADPTGRIIYTNNLVGPRGTGQPSLMRIRRILLP